MSTKANGTAKNATRLLAFSVWFPFALWLSFWTVALLGFIEQKLLPAKTAWTIYLLTWTGCVWMFAWVPIWWARRRHLAIARSLGRDITFLSLLLLCTVYCTIAWDKYIADKLYMCTDSVPYVFVHPGDWVHGNYVYAPQSAFFPRSMSEPDAIKEGWSIPKLWILYWSFVAASVGTSASLAFLIWWPKTRKSVPLA
jgi:hypothetical protein